ncbi:MAG TPA: hypothetical protein EYP36_02330 [Calditrichaeota bacterium]|nr:hypothetical protein [Calditrichota bacterium]
MRIYPLILLLILTGLFLFSCSESSSSIDDVNKEFIADLDDFKGYQNWTQVDIQYGPDPLLQAAHGTDDGLYRRIYVKNNVQPDNGKYPTGTIILKELRDPDGNLTGALTMLVKRDGGFNPDGNGWEWFMTDTKLETIFTQGDNATAGGGVCASCHSGANVNNNGTDWVFNHPDNREYVAELDDFKDYLNWTKVTTNFGPDPFLQSAHGVSDSLYRNIYFKDDVKAVNGEYLKRTIILKELRDKDGNLAGATTVLVKRGGNFNPDGNGWEWFMVDTELTTVMTRGDNATAGGGACASCHNGANTSSNGMDWVFTQP